MSFSQDNYFGNDFKYKKEVRAIFLRPFYRYFINLLSFSYSFLGKTPTFCRANIFATRRKRYSVWYIINVFIYCAMKKGG